MELHRRNVNFWPLLFVFFAASSQAVFIEPRQAFTSQRSLAESATRLPCRYQGQVGETVVQVTWYKELSDGTKDQIITAHFSDGQTEFRGYVGRMRFESDDPIANSALLIPNTDESDDGMYACHISTFPNGNFERRIRLTVWVLPISSLEPVMLVEGQSFRVAASCRAVGRPLPILSWDTTVPGKSQNRTSDAGSVSSYFSLHPLRSMNGKRLDCLVRHPALERPRRIVNQLVVHYPPDATITATTDNWFVGLDHAALICQTSGFPVPEDIIWTWKGGALPDGAAASGGRLTFGRGLRLNDSGLYQCAVSNGVGMAKADYMMTVTVVNTSPQCVLAAFLAEKSQQKEVLPSDSSTLIIVGASAGAAVLVMAVMVAVLVRHHRRRSRKLKRQLSVKTEEVNTLSRQASFKRLNSIGSDPRSQSEEYALLRTDSRMKNSQVSLERPIYRDSQSTLGGRWAPLGVSEADGRPSVWQDESDDIRVAVSDAERDDPRRRANSYQKSSNMSLDSGLPSSLLPLKVQTDDASVPTPPSDVCESVSPSEENWCPPPPPPLSEPCANGPEDGEDGGGEPYQLSQALTNHFYYSNGVLRPRPHANAILMHPSGQVI
ncbi:nectin-4 isoform X2 [Corythoichthys intestinalis]|uniref:nectin-4 isoform X2 n=1 Tax=Corythoichthys intestinalis TaxID=161448 RepID=UPI0025A5AF01|nr:nectin-4 isoform X2 [Corythoichthys intestinalis]